MTTAESGSETSASRSATRGRTGVLENIQEPGAYVCRWSGHLLRVSAKGVPPSCSPRFNLVASEPLHLTKISDNPWITISKARMLAANFDLQVSF